MSDNSNITIHVLGIGKNPAEYNVGNPSSYHWSRTMEDTTNSFVDRWIRMDRPPIAEKGPDKFVYEDAEVSEDTQKIILTNSNVSISGDRYKNGDFWVKGALFDVKLGDRFDYSVEYPNRFTQIPDGVDAYFRHVSAVGNPTTDNLLFSAVYTLDIDYSGTNLSDIIKPVEDEFYSYVAATVDDLNRVNQGGFSWTWDEVINSDIDLKVVKKENVHYSALIEVSSGSYNTYLTIPKWVDLNDANTIISLFSPDLVISLQARIQATDINDDNAEPKYSYITKKCFLGGCTDDGKTIYDIYTKDDIINYYIILGDETKISDAVSVNQYRESSIIKSISGLSNTVSDYVCVKEVFGDILKVESLCHDCLTFCNLFNGCRIGCNHINISVDGAPTPYKFFGLFENAVLIDGADMRIITPDAYDLIQPSDNMFSRMLYNISIEKREGNIDSGTECNMAVYIHLTNPYAPSYTEYENIVINSRPAYADDDVDITYTIDGGAFNDFIGLKDKEGCAVTLGWPYAVPGGIQFVDTAHIQNKSYVMWRYKEYRFSV